MTLAELKERLGVPAEDTSKDLYYADMLESGLLAAQSYCDRLDFLTLVDPETGLLVLPAAVRLGIVEWIKASEAQSERGGVISESVGGMSQSFESGDAAVYRAAYNHWKVYHSSVRFIPMGGRR